MTNILHDIFSSIALIKNDWSDWNSSFSSIWIMMSYAANMLLIPVSIVIWKPKKKLSQHFFFIRSELILINKVGKSKDKTFRNNEKTHSHKMKCFHLVQQITCNYYYYYGNTRYCSETFSHGNGTPVVNVNAKNNTVANRVFVRF